jgi:hypothetical protein
MLGLKKYGSLAQIATFLALGFAASSCGSGPEVKGVEKKKGTEDGTASTEESSEEIEIDDVIMPPQEYYDTLFAETVGNADKKEFGLASAEQVLFVNFEGATVVKGFSRTQSFIPCRQNSTIPSPQLSPADKQAILDLVQAHYNDIGALLKVTAEKPSSGDFTTIHVGGAYSDLGCIGRGVLGIAPFDQGNSNRNDIGFAFTKGVNSNRIIAETISHEAGHSFGLDHVESRKDLMYFSSTNEITGFTVSRVARGAKIQDAPAILKSVLGSGTAVAGAVNPAQSTTGTQNPVQPVPGIANVPNGLANLPGLNQIGNLGQLIPGISQVGPLDINTLLAQAIAVIPASAGNTNLPQFDKILAAIGVAAQAGANQKPGGAAGAVGNIATLAGSILSNPTVSTFANIAALAGLGAAGPAAVSGIQAILNGISGVSSQQPNNNTPALPAGLPDLSALLGLVNSSTTNAALITNLLNSVQVVNTNFTGTTQAALISLLKVSYSQAYNQINSK